MNKNINCMDMRDGNVKNSTVTVIECCPLCHAKIYSECVFALSWPYVDPQSDKGIALITVLNFCSGCKGAFVSTFSAEYGDFKNGVSIRTLKMLSCEPQTFEEKEFETKIIELSPSFVKIYNQARQAECSKLDQIAGIGYRKAVEFLVKDYAIHQNPDKAEAIKSMLLMNCINEYTDNSRVKMLAQKTVWLGNDETHYIRQHTDKDITDMKRFIDALVYFINMVLITEEAEAIEKA